MTREEAIKMLEYLATDTTGTLAGEQGYSAEFLVRVIDSLDMAISALREQESAKNAHCNCCKKGNSSWISVEDRLPNQEHDWVLVACKLMPEGFYGVPHVAELRSGVWWSDCYDVPLRSAGVVVTHWMPLPTPPEVEV